MWADGKWLFLWLVSLFHVEIFINIVFLSHVCNQQETMLGSFQEGWEKGEWMMIHSGFCLAGEQASAQGMGSKEHPLIPLKPKNAKLLRQHQQPSRVTLHQTPHFIQFELSPSQDGHYFMYHWESKGIPVRESNRGAPHETGTPTSHS